MKSEFKVLLSADVRRRWVDSEQKEKIKGDTATRSQELKNHHK